MSPFGVSPLDEEVDAESANFEGEVAGAPAAAEPGDDGGVRALFQLVDDVFGVWFEPVG